MTRSAVALVFSSLLLAGSASAQEAEFDDDTDASHGDGVESVPVNAPTYNESTPSAESDGPEEPLTIHLSLGLGYGLATADDPPLAVQGLTLRPRLGVTLPERFYVGAMFNYTFGGQDDVLGTDEMSNTTVKVGTVSGTSYYVGAELGYDFHLGSALVVRPTAGFGATFLASELCGNDDECASDTSSYSSALLAARVLLPIGPLYFGAELSYLAISTQEGVNPPDQVYFGIEIGLAPSINLR